MLTRINHFYALCILLLAWSTYESNFILASELQQPTFYKCLKQGGANRVGLIIFYDPTGKYDLEIKNLGYAQNATLTV